MTGMNSMSRYAQGSSNRFEPFAKVLYYLIPVAILLVFRSFLPGTIWDDAYISFRVAVNTASGLGMVFNHGENTYVSTSPMWVLLLAVSRMIIGDTVLAAKILGVVFNALLLLSIVHLAKQANGKARAGMFAALLLVTNPVFLLTSLSGMELPLFLLLIVLTALSLCQRRYAISMALGAIAVWVRFDGIVIFGMSVILSLWFQRKTYWNRQTNAFMDAIPGAVIMLGYVLFGILFFGTWVPMSVQRKALGSFELLSTKWLGGFKIILLEFVNAIFGKSAYWYTHKTPFLALVIPLSIGGILQLVYKKKSLVSLFLLTTAYVGAFMSTGRAYAANFPWYFAPILPATCLLCGVGIDWILSSLSKESSLLQKAERCGVLTALAVIGWLTVSTVPLYRNAESLINVKDERERVYATAAVWAGKYAGRDVLVGANEIGAIGFFLPREASVVDMFGLLSSKETLRVSYVQRIRDVLPACIFTMAYFSYKETLESEMDTPYHWVRFRTLDIGIRSDLIDSLAPQLSELDDIYEMLNVDREFNWDSIAEKHTPIDN